MDLSGEIELDDATRDEAWRVFSDPESIRDAIPGCKFIAPADEVRDLDAESAGAELDVDIDADGAPEAPGPFEEGDEYVAVVQVGVGDIRPRFELKVHIAEREFPRISAHVDGAGGDSAFRMETAVKLVETGDGVTIDWRSTVDISGRLSAMNSSIVRTVSEKLVERFFERIERDVREAGS